MDSRNKRYIGSILFLGLLLLIPILLSPVYATAEESFGRKSSMVLGHASADDNEFRIQLSVGDTRTERVNPRAIYAKGIDQVYTYTSLALSDDSDEATYDKNYAKAKKGYWLEAVAADSSIVKVTSETNGRYTLKALKNGSTVVRFYEIYQGVRSYLGCRTIYVGNPDATEDTVTIFIGSKITWPAGWESQDYHDYDPKLESGVIDIPENKTLFKKVYYYSGSKAYYYVATKTGKTKVTASVNGVKKTFWANIVEPFISKNAKLNYTLYAGNEIDFADNFYLFDYDTYGVEERYIKLVSDNEKVASAKRVVLSEENQYNKIITNKAGTAHIKVYFEYGGKSKYLGMMTLKVLSSQTIRLTDKADQLINGESYQFQAEITGINDTITWSVSDPSVAIIDENTGLLTTIDTGSVTVTAEAGGLKASYLVNVKGKKKLTITGRKEFVAGEMPNYTVATLKTGEKITWSISDEKKAEIKGSGKRISLSSFETGTVTLYAETATARGELEITIQNVGIKGPTETTVGKYEWYSITGDYWEDAVTTDWVSSDESILQLVYYDGASADVDILAAAPGTAVLTAYNKYGAKVSITVTVNP